MANLKVSTAYTRMFLVVATSDHITGLTGASPVVNLSKAGGSFAGAGGTITEVANGYYKIALTTTDTNTLGDLAFHITATSGDPSDFVDQVTSSDLNAVIVGTNNDKTGYTASTVTDKTGYSLTQAFPTNFSSLSIDGSGRVDIGKALGTAVTLDANNVLNVSAKYVGGTLQTARDLGLSVLLSSGTGTGQLSLSSGTVTVGTNNDKTGYSLTQSFPTNFSSLAITVGGAVTVGTNSDKTGYSLTQAFPANFSSLSIDASGRIDIGKALGTAVTLDANNVLNVSAKYVNGTLQTARDLGASVLLSAGTGTGQIALTSGAVTVGTNNDKTGYTASTVTDKTGYSLTQSFPTNFATLAIDGSGRTDMGKIVGDSTAATILKTGLNTVATGVVGAGSTTTSIVTSSLTPSGTASGQFNGRIIIFGDGTSTAALQGQATNVTACTAAANPTFTVTALTTAPGAGDTFIIV